MLTNTSAMFLLPIPVPIPTANPSVIVDILRSIAILIAKNETKFIFEQCLFHQIITVVNLAGAQLLS